MDNKVSDELKNCGCKASVETKTGSSLGENKLLAGVVILGVAGAITLFGLTDRSERLKEEFAYWAYLLAVYAVISAGQAFFQSFEGETDRQTAARCFRESILFLGGGLSVK